MAFSPLIQQGGQVEGLVLQLEVIAMVTREKEFHPRLSGR